MYKNIVIESDECKNTLIPCFDGKQYFNTPLYCLLNDIRTNKTENLEISNVKCRIAFGGFAYCGYIKDEEFTKDLDYNEFEGIIHGGFTAHWGFDCAHHGDIFLFIKTDSVEVDTNFNGSTFKTKEFVRYELENLIRDIKTNIA
jgi:hypothetical protein